MSTLALQEDQLRAEELYHAREKDGVFNESLKSMGRVASGSKMTAPVEAIKLGFYLRSQIGQHREGVIAIALMLALAIDGLGFIPFAGWIVTWFCRPVLLILLWGKGAWKVKVVYKLLIIFDFIPLVQNLPLSTVGVIYVYMKLKKQSKESEIQLNELKESYGEAV